MVQLCRLYGLQFGIHVHKVFTPTCTHFNLSEASLIRWHIDHLVQLSGARLDVKLKEITPEVEVNLWRALEDTLPWLEYPTGMNFSYGQLVTTRPYCYTSKFHT